MTNIVTTIGNGLTGMVTSLTTGLSSAFSGLFLTSGGELTELATFGLTFVGIGAAIGACTLVLHIFSRGGKR